MLDDRDLNRDLGPRDAYLDDPAVRDGSGYGPVIALVAIALVIGGLFMFSPSGDRTQTATNNAPVVERSAPPPATPAPTPPVTAPKQ
jgi:hypothetical protein